MSLNEKQSRKPQREVDYRALFVVGMRREYLLINGDFVGLTRKIRKVGNRVLTRTPQCIQKPPSKTRVS